MADEMVQTDETYAQKQQIPCNNWDKPFWRSVFAGATGGGSSARICMMLVVTTSLIWVSWIVYKSQMLPHELFELGAFVSMVVSVVFVPGKVADIMNSRRG